MSRLALCLLSLFALGGCSDNSAVAPSDPSSVPSDESSAPSGASSAPEAQQSVSPEPADSTSDGTQTVEGDGFTFQAPSTWRVQKLSAEISVSSPTDLANAVPGVPISFGLLPTQPALPPDALIPSLIKSDKNLGDVESETVVEVSGRSSQKLVTVKKYPSHTQRTIKLYIPLDSKVLLAQVQGDDKYIAPVQSEIDSILSSLTISP